MIAHVCEAEQAVASHGTSVVTLVWTGLAADSGSFLLPDGSTDAPTTEVSSVVAVVDDLGPRRQGISIQRSRPKGEGPKDPPDSNGCPEATSGQSISNALLEQCFAPTGIGRLRGARSCQQSVEPLDSGGVSMVCASD